MSFIQLNNYYQNHSKWTDGKIFLNFSTEKGFLTDSKSKARKENFAEFGYLKESMDAVPG